MFQKFKLLATSIFLSKFFWKNFRTGGGLRMKNFRMMNVIERETDIQDKIQEKKHAGE